MSAYLCSQNTINALATFAHKFGIVEDPILFADLLTLANVRSICSYYRTSPQLPDMIAPAKTRKYEPVDVSASTIITMADEYDYQACEPDDYETTLVYRLIVQVTEHAQAIAALEEPGGCGAMRFPRFFSIDDAKAVKAQKVTRRWLNAINYMAPAATAGVGNLCPHASEGCKALCLGEWSGQAGMRREGEDNSVTRSRKAKAVYYMRERVAFMRECATHIDRALERAKLDGRRLCVRLNGSTDIAWEGASVDGRRLMSLFGDVQFIDYTKSVRRALRSVTDPTWPSNYRLTFSRSEDNESDCLAVLRAGGTVAVVSSMARPARWHGFRTVDGDKHDLRHLDPLAAVVWLSPKGNKAKRDASGFVLRPL
jgi:hypothetical protein